ncbi:short-chain dehydrogenase/reductase SDR [Hyphomonas johnsonii MHS-2]|uniref:Short-chain dehydrogenase/reductase SDR n=2 Tax=Hyphomonas johnsonii TaxID=81031 RepID=A0A059FBC8_9PROT|nr:short-chain dehydrogenase/reductase SDR [Hyphomonas johnsonii MHS-2]
MKLGIEGKKALVCASSKGLGYACALALSREGARVTINGRDEATLGLARDSIESETGHPVDMIVADVSSQEGRERIVETSQDTDILVNNNGGPPPGSFENWSEEDWTGAVQANMIPALMLIKNLLPGMRSRAFGRIVNITSAMVKSPRAPMALSAAARTGLTAACKAIVPEIARDNVTINFMLPERFDTDRQVGMAKLLAKRRQISYADARIEIANSIAARRFGRPDEFGATCAFLCSEHAGFISGQNIQLDGGSYAGLF